MVCSPKLYVQYKNKIFIKGIVRGEERLRSNQKRMAG
jgi:hypothetical protein